MKILKSFRKTMTMNIDKTWKLIVKAPLFTSKKQIDEFIWKHKKWIDNKTKKVLDKVKKYNEKDRFLFFWEEYELNYSWTSKIIDFDWMNFYLDKKYKKNAAVLFENFYKDEARKYINKRIVVIAEKYNLKYNNLKITSAKTRWGSCTSAKNINFSYRLIMAPIKTIDYVIVHELAHLTEMNHSKKFWDLVEKMTKGLYPWDYKVHKKWLNDHWDNLIF